MPQKLFIAIRRRPDLTPEKFRHLYETSHVKIALELFGHLWSEYRRNYVQPAGKFGFDEPVTEQDPVFRYDVITELVFKHEDGLAEMTRIFTENLDRITTDERRMFDRKDCWLLSCETLVEDMSGM